MRKVFLLTVLIILSFSLVFAIQLPAGVPRSETLICDIDGGRVGNPHLWNPYAPGWRGDAGLHTIMMEYMWEINSQTGKWIPLLTEGFPEALDENYTKWRIKLKKGIYWSDGVEFTADDVAFTIMMLATRKEIPIYTFWHGLIKEAKAEDKYTVYIELKRPYAKLITLFANILWGAQFKVVPKHIWEKVDDYAKYENYPPVFTGPYVLKDYDPSGYWFLYEKRKDWDKSGLGKTVGEPTPKYILYYTYGPEEKRVIAAAQHNLDQLVALTPEGWDALRRRDKFARAWYKDFPWGWPEDGCAKGITFNCAKPPFDNKLVRWALILAIDAVEVNKRGFGGTVKYSPYHIPPLTVYKEPYFDALDSWIRNFSLPDGYKPFDPDIPIKTAKYYAKKYDIPTDPEGAKSIFGYGWWRYDPEEAERLLKSQGFTKKNGKWYLPNGEPWRITIIGHGAFNDSTRIALIVADQWRRFGIDANAQLVEASAFTAMHQTGDFEVSTGWPGCGAIPDFWASIGNNFHKRWVKPIGEVSTNNVQRWVNDKYSELSNEMEKYQPTDPKVVEIGREMLKILIEEQPFTPIVGTTKIVPVDTYYWEGWPTADNSYMAPTWWWGNFKLILPHLKPTGRK
ncbi:MAG: ABC transporter substrate-binding protein [Thermotogae bacterium]|nr:ABC transporter substrate-binding protein [Thermotogota bacterium]